MSRTYKPGRKPAPTLWDIVRLRSLGESFAAIADAYGCHRQTIWVALNRAADRGELPPVLASVLYPDDSEAAARLLQRIAEAGAASARPLPRFAPAPEASRGAAPPGRQAF